MAVQLNQTEFGIWPSSLELSTFARPSIFKTIHFHFFGLSTLYLTVEFDYFRYRRLCIQTRTCRQTTFGYISYPKGSSKRILDRKIASIRSWQPERHSANRTKYAWRESKDETFCFSHRLSSSFEPLLLFLVLSDPVERLYSFINHCTVNKWPFCQGRSVESLIKYTTNFFVHFNSTSYYENEHNPFPSIFYEEFINVGLSVFQKPVMTHF